MSANISSEDCKMPISPQAISSEIQRECMLECCSTYTEAIQPTDEAIVSEIPKRFKEFMS